MTRRALALLLLAAPAAAAVRPPAPEPLTPYVDPFIGTGGAGNTYPGAQVPWGMVSVSPHTDLAAPAGYRAPARVIYGLGHLHLSGVGCPGLGNVLVAAAVGAPVTAPEEWKSALAGERAAPGWYRADLATWGVAVEATATARASLLRFTFPARPRGDARIVLDAGHRLGGDAPAGATPYLAGVTLVSPSEIEGWSDGGNFCGSGGRHRVYFAARLSRPALSASTWIGGLLSATPSASGRDVGALLSFATRRSESVLVKVGISTVSTAAARANREAEIPGWDPAAVRAAAVAAWERELGRIRVRGGAPEQRRVFYTALYHALLHPSVISDADGGYAGRGGAPRMAGGRDQYSVFSLWDTYRTLHPLLALVWPGRQTAMLDSLAAIARATGALPRWELLGNDTRVMVGDPAAIVVADSWLKGLRGFDAGAAWGAARRAAFEPGPQRPGLAALARYGYLPEDDTGGDWVWGPVSTHLEYALADWHLARWAEAQGLADDAKALDARARTWRAAFDPATGLFRPRLKSGAWQSPFSPLAAEAPGGWAGSGGPGFVEGTAWSYAFSVPHDVPGLVEAHGGPDDFTDHLGAFLTRRGFTPGNEHDLHAPWLFDFVPAEAWRTQRAVRDILGASFRAAPDGLPGNDDAGTLSAWAVWAMLGLYPTCPGSTRYEIATPVFESAELTPEEGYWPGKKITIRAEGASSGDAYIQAVTWNGAGVETPHVAHADLVRGGTLAVTLGPFPSAWGGMARLPFIREAPSSTRVVEGRPARFAVRAGGTGPLEFQWRRSGQDIPDAKTPEFRVPIAPRAADGIAVTCLVKSPFGRIETAAATLWVDPDREPPQPTSALRAAPTRETPWTVLTVTFTEPVEGATAKDGANWSLYPVVPIDRIALSADGREVLLDLARALDPAVRTRLDIKKVRDRAWSPNVMAPVRLDVLPAGNGLQGEYFAAPDLSGPARRVTDPEVDFDWGAGPPLPGIPPDGFSVRWRGRVRPEATGVHTFTVRADDGVRLWVAGARVVDDWHDQAPAEHSGTVFLEAGKPVEIWLEYYERGLNATCRLAWSPPGGLSAVIPRRNLYR